MCEFTVDQEPDDVQPEPSDWVTAVGSMTETPERFSLDSRLLQDCDPDSPWSSFMATD